MVNYRRSIGSARNRRKKGRLDLTHEQIAEICRTEASAVEWCRENGLLPRSNRNAPTPCWKANCGGELKEDVKRTAAHGNKKALEQHGFRCKRCRAFRSARNGTQVLGRNANADYPTFFTRLDSQGRPNTKVKYSTVLLMLWYWAKRHTREKTIECLHDRIGWDGGCLTDWWNYVREVLQADRERAPMMGGPGRIIQIDECFLRGRRKNNVGRMMAGNQVPGARNNYGAAVVGPWVFGMVELLPDGRREIRMNPVLRRNRPTLRARLQASVAPGSIVQSDQWRAYMGPRGVAAWAIGGPPYVHRTVNHSQNFVDPLTGANTQRMERMWKDVRQQHVRQRNNRAVANGNLQLTLDEYWWFSLHDGCPFLDLIGTITQQYPQHNA